MNGVDTSTPDAPGIAVFDLCDTLYYSNTTHDFVRYVAKSRFSITSKLFHKLANSRRSPFRYFFLAVSLATGFDVHKSINLRFLRGFTRVELEQLAEGFVCDFLDRRPVDQTHALLREMLRSGARVVLASSSIEPVVRAVARKMMITDWVCTTLEYASERMTGRVLLEVSGRKLSALKPFGGVPGKLLCVVSDNKSDLSLLKAAEHPIAVVHSDSALQFWNKISVEVIDLRK
jgi:phosphoserine phosphatase